jgi:hypothetical protein
MEAILRFSRGLMRHLIVVTVASLFSLGLYHCGI